MLTLSTVRKLMRESFRGESSVVPPERRMAWLEALHSRLDGSDRSSVRFVEIIEEKAKPRRTERLAISVDPPRPARCDWRGGDSFLVRFDQAGVPHIEIDGWRRDGKTRAAIADADHVAGFLASVRERQDRLTLREKKHEKVAHLRKHTLAARLRELADLHRFAFALEVSHRHLRLAIRIERKTGYVLSFPVSRFDEVHQLLPALLADLRKLLSLGVSIKTGMMLRRHSSTEWIEPAPPAPETPGKDLRRG